MQGEVVEFPNTSLAEIFSLISLFKYTGWPRKNGTAYMYFPQHMDGITGIGV